jgi:hypothetical protein
MDTDRLEGMFKAKYASLVVEGDPDATYENWFGYCDENKIFLLHPHWLKESLNEGEMKGRICIHTPEKVMDVELSPWLLVPKKLAERALVLGGLP